MRILVTGSEHLGGLAALRALREGGFEPWAAVISSAAPGARSRAAAGVVHVPDPRLDADGFAEVLAAAAERLRARAVLPGTEAALLALADRRARFPSSASVGACARELTVRATDKGAVHLLAGDAGVDTLPYRLASLDGAPADPIPYPAVVKPLRSELLVDGELRRFEARRVTAPEGLARALEALPERAAFVQPYREGRLRTVNGVAWRGRTVASVQVAGSRTWPLDCGVVSYAETVRRDARLEEAGRALVEALRWSGLFNAQFIEADGRAFLIDFNPRFYTSLALPVAAGVNLPAIWTALLLGRRPDVPPYRIGVRFRSEDDLRALAAMLLRGPRARALLGALPRSRTVHGLFSARDRRPALALARRTIEQTLPAWMRPGDAGVEAPGGGPA